jgi:hypothetical protein
LALAFLVSLGYDPIKQLLCKSSAWMRFSVYLCYKKMEIAVSILFLFLQIENEYGYYESAYGDGGKRYAMWAASMAVSQNIGVPWIMCQQFDAPDTVVRICFLT